MRADLPPPHVLPRGDQPSSPWLPTPGTYRYFATAAAGCGVPAFWIPDAVGDMVLAAWLDGRADPLSVRRNAIDCARRYGRQNRYGTRPALVRLDQHHAAPEPAIVLYVDLARAMRHLTSRQRAALRRRRDGLPMTNLDSRHASSARQRLRRLLCA